MQYSKPKMEQLVKNDPELTKKLKQIMKEHDLEKSFALKALYHWMSKMAENIRGITRSYNKG